MSQDQLFKLLEAARVDAFLHDQLQTASDHDALVFNARQAGFAVTVDDLQGFRLGLCEDELEAMTGGLMTGGSICCNIRG